MTTYYIPKIFNPHNFGPENGSYFMMVYLTLDELRRYHPEPIEYFTFTDTSNQE